jgi:hypothetical protein
MEEVAGFKQWADMGRDSTNDIWIEWHAAGTASGVRSHFADEPVVSLVPRSTTGYNLGSLRLPRHGLRPQSAYG